MSSTHDGHKPSSPSCGKPFRSFFHMGWTPSPRLSLLLKVFEETLEERLKGLMPKLDSSEVLTLSWMTSAIQSLSETHVDVKTLIADLEFPSTDWDEQWMDVYLDDSVKLLDICISLNSKLSHLDQGQLFLQYALHSLDSSESVVPSMERVKAARRSLDNWVCLISCKSPKLANSLTILEDLMGSLHPSAKVKNSAKAKVLMKAMYGVKVQTIFICSVLTAALSGSEATLLELQVPDKFLWSEAFHLLQAVVNGQIRTAASRRVEARGGTLLRDFEDVYACTEKLLTLTSRNDPDVDMIEAATDDDAIDGKEEESEKNSGVAIEMKKVEVMEECVLNLREGSQRLSVGLDKLSKQVNSFFQIVLTGRDALLCNLRMPGTLEGD